MWMWDIGDTSDVHKTYLKCGVCWRFYPDELQIKSDNETNNQKKKTVTFVFSQIAPNISSSPAFSKFMDVDIQSHTFREMSGVVCFSLNFELPSPLPEVSIILVTGSYSIRAVLFVVKNFVDGWDRVVQKNVVKFRGMIVIS